MKVISNLFLVLLSTTLSASLSSPLPPIEIQNYKFFDSKTGEEFIVKGIDYYPRPNTGDLNANSMDLFTDEHHHIWERDIPFLQELGVNAVRLYAVNATANHDAFMCAMNSAGIYVIVALAHDCPTCAVTRDASPNCYPHELKTQGQAVIRAFAKYSNTLGFSAGNEVNHFAPIGLAQWNAPCQKKFLRDMRAYIASCPHLRNVPIGLVSADTERDVLAKYYNCRTDPDDEYETAEWYGLNIYVYCNGKALTYDEALGFQLLGQSFESYDYSIPVLLTEFGCLSKTFPTQDGYEGQRNFLQAKWLLEEPFMRDVFSGGFAFEFSTEMAYAKSDSPYPFTHLGGQNYGIGHFANETCDDITQPCSYVPHPSFYSLKEQYNTAVITSQATKDTYMPDEKRLSSSTCPPNYPKLQEFKWAPDKTENLACPNRGMNSQFVCPVDYKELLLQEEMMSGESTGRTELLAWIGAFILTAFGVHWVVVSIRKNRGTLESPHVRKPSVDGSLSDESEGLLSMKGYARASGGQYQALSSDSSSEDLIGQNEP